MALSAPNSRFFALIPSAGSGSRARGAMETTGAFVPKQFQPLAGRPMLAHTLAAFAGVPRIHEVLVVLSPGGKLEMDTAPNVRAADVGGSTRAQSVAGGLRHLLEGAAQPSDWVLVHDAARCLVTPALIEKLIDACENDAVGGLLAHKLPDTLKAARGDRVAATLPRDDKWLAQTPQMFRIGALSQALAQAGDAVTDEASAMEAAGHAPKLVAGGAQNFKVTYAEDFELAEAILRSRKP
ncbi:MAG: 2-C-methyl-D-erythritol 4-phosphate cytidylyltransferase [Burkholderiaceae bacterium]